MSVRKPLYRVAAPAAFALLAVAGCEGRETEPMAVSPANATADHVSHARAKQTSNAEVARWLAGLRRATAPYHRIAVADDAGWNVPLTGCMELPGTGGMGYHFGNGGLIDAVPEEFAPELLVYEPKKNGELKLVAVEYIVPFDLWTNEEPPSLHGIEYHRNEAFGLWVLHAWVWKNNPAGMFEDWNPTVSCAFAAPVEG